MPLNAATRCPGSRCKRPRRDRILIGLRQTQHGILQNTSATNTTLEGNFIESVGSECNLDHGIYFQTSGRVTRNVFKDIPLRLRHPLFAHSSHVIVAENTSVGSRVRAGVVIHTDGSDIVVVNNNFSGNATYGIYYQACGSDCVVDNNLTWGNALGGGNLAGAGDEQPQRRSAVHRRGAITSRRRVRRSIRTQNDYAYFPDLDEVPGVVGSGPDSGAFER